MVGIVCQMLKRSRSRFKEIPRARTRDLHRSPQPSHRVSESSPVPGPAARRRCVSPQAIDNRSLSVKLVRSLMSSRQDGFGSKRTSGIPSLRAGRISLIQNRIGLDPWS